MQVYSIRLKIIFAYVLYFSMIETFLQSLIYTY